MYTVAISNVFGLFGYTSNGEVSYNPDIEILETDEFGRVLFFYDEYYNDSIDPKPDFGMAFVIMQKCTDNYVYYYQDACYFPYFDTVDDYEEVLKRVDANDLNELKMRNDWNKELDESKCTKTQKTTIKPDGNVKVKDYEFDTIIYSYAKANGYQGSDKKTFKFSKYCNSDIYGKELYYVYCMSSDDYGNGETVYGTYDYAVIVNSDGSFSDNPIVEITDLTNSYETIELLKQQNNWNQPN